MGKLKYKPGDAVRRWSEYGYIHSYVGNSWYRVLRITNGYSGVAVRLTSTSVRDLRSVDPEWMQDYLNNMMNKETHLNALIRRATPDNYKEVVRLMRSYIRSDRRMLRNALKYTKKGSVPIPTFEELSKYNIEDNYGSYRLEDLRAAA